MAVKIRLKKLGTNKRPHSRIIVCEESRARDARVIDQIGFYDPSQNPALLKVDRAKAEKWLQTGAVPSDTVRSLLKKEGIV